jgi:hypothetical protein
MLHPHPQLGPKPLNRALPQPSHRRLGDRQCCHPFPPCRSKRLRRVQNSRAGKCKASILGSYGDGSPALLRHYRVTSIHRWEGAEAAGESPSYSRIPFRRNQSCGLYSGEIGPGGGGTPGSNGGVSGSMSGSGSGTSRGCVLGCRSGLVGIGSRAMSASLACQSISCSVFRISREFCGQDRR